MLGLISLIIANQSSLQENYHTGEIYVGPLLFSLAPQCPHFFHSRIATVTPVSHPLTRLIRTNPRCWKIYVRLKLFSKWELPIGLNFKSNVLYKSIASKRFSPIWIMFQKILLKWCFFNGVARTFPTHKHMGVGRGAVIWNFQQKVVFSYFRVVKNKFHHFRLPAEKLLEKSASGPLGKIPSDDHAYNHAKWHHFCEKLCCNTPSGNTVQQHQCGKQSIAGWQTVHSVLCQTITKSCRIHCQLQIICQK